MKADVRRYRSLEELIRSQLSDVAGPQPGVMFVLHHLRRLDAYTAVGTAIDMRDRELLNQLRWIEVSKTADGWSCNPLNEDERKPFLDTLTPSG